MRGSQVGLADYATDETAHPRFALFLEGLLDRSALFDPADRNPGGNSVGMWCVSMPL